MMKRQLWYCWIFLGLFTSLSVKAQDDYVVNQSKFIQKFNPSYFGVNQLNKVGVMYNALKINDFTTLDNKYVFGSIAFQNLNFSLGFDVSSFSMGDTGLTSTQVNMSYVYKIQFDNETFFLPSITLGLGSSNINVQNLIFEDQLDTTTGFINTETLDPLAPQIAGVNYFDLSASFLIHSEDFIAGLSLRHLNKPNTSFNQDEPFEKPIRINVQGGYEFNINPYEQRYLPRYSFLFLYGNFSKYGDSMYMSLNQDFQLGEFSLGFTQQAALVETFGLNNIGLTLGLALENFDFGVNYNFPLRSPGQVYSPSVFELSVVFDFSIYRRNNRGLYKRLQIDNYY